MQHFTSFGPILSCKIATRPDGSSRGFGFVNYDNPSSALKAIDQMSGFSVDGKKLKVEVKKGEAKKKIMGIPKKVCQGLTLG